MLTAKGHDIFNKKNIQILTLELTDDIWRSKSSCIIITDEQQTIFAEHTVSSNNFL